MVRLPASRQTGFPLRFGFSMLHHIPSPEIQDRLFAEV
jgi:hypothetical protein